MAKEPPTALAAVLQLHGIDPAQIKAANRILRGVSISVEDHDFGPAYENARTELDVVQQFMQKLSDRL
jgi:hypothetical protein